jgi:hypothetical protein
MLVTGFRCVNIFSLKENQFRRAKRVTDRTNLQAAQTGRPQTGSRDLADFPRGRLERLFVAGKFFSTH